MIHHEHLMFSIISAVTGIPLIFVFYKYIQHKTAYKASNPEVYNDVFELFSPKFFLNPKNQSERLINKWTVILYVFIITWIVSNLISFSKFS